MFKILGFTYLKKKIHLFFETYGILTTGFLSGKAFATLIPTHTALIVDHILNKDRNGLFQLFGTMLINSKNKNEITRLRNKIVPLGKREKGPKYQESLNNNNLTVNFFHDNVQYLTKSG